MDQVKVMPKTRIVTLAPFSDKRLSVIDDSAVLWSSCSSGWEDLIIEQHRHNQLDTPEFELPDYSLIVQLSPLIKIESKVNGNFESRNSKTGNICLFSAGARRQVRTNGRIEVLVITLTKAAINKAVGRTNGNLDTELIEHQQLFDPQIEYMCRALKAEVESDYVTGRLYAEALSMALSTYLVAKYSVAKPLHREQKGGLSPRSLRRVVEYINENLADELRLTELAEIAGLSQYRFSHNFKHSTGLAPHQFVIRERIKRAKHMLRETDMSLISIAFAVGCGSPSRFTLLFRRATGVTPSAYRASFK
jgi:AraC family transcriptional regulator